MAEPRPCWVCGAATGKGKNGYIHKRNAEPKWEKPEHEVIPRGSKRHAEIMNSKLGLVSGDTPRYYDVTDERGRPRGNSRFYKED